MQWKYFGQTRPHFADEAQASQESVWDYPRPPSIEFDTRHVRVCAGNLVVANTHSAVRVLETASPPGVYIPREDVRMELLRLSAQHSLCEWKGQATYFDVQSPKGVIPAGAWSYERPQPGFEAIAGHISFYPGRLECYIDDERVEPQPGRFYGGWLTADIVGPVKGGPGTAGW